MSYYDPNEDFPYDPAVDPWLGGGDPAMQQALLAIMLNQDPNYMNANMPTFDMGQVQAGAGLVPQYQPSGDPLTVAQQNTAFNAQRSALFDTGLMGAIAGPQAFAAGTFEPTVTSVIRQEPELQQVYGYLRSPTSVEGIITQELMNGGSPASAARNLRQIFTKTDEEVAAMFAEYDAIFGRQPSVTVEDVPRIRENLLLELPQREGMEGAPPPPVTVENVNWDQGEFSVAGQARGINELNAQIPRVGPSGPQYDPRTGVQISAGGDLQWGVDETGAPVLVETTSTPSEAAQTFLDVGLPSPADEYTTEDFLSPQLQEEQALYQSDYLPAYRELMARLDPFAESPFGEITPEMRTAATPLPIAPANGMPPRDAGVTPEEMAMVDQVRGNALNPQPVYDPLSSISDPQVIAPLADQLIAEGHDLPPHWTYEINPDGSIGDPLPPEYLPGGSGGGLYPELRQPLPEFADRFTGEEPPPEPVDWTTDLPTPGELNRLTAAPYDPLSSIQPRGGSGVRSSMEDFLAQGPAGGFPTPGGPGYTQGAAEQARQPGDLGTPNPTVAAMLAQMLASGASAGQPVRPRLDYGSSEGPAYTDYLATLPPYAQPGAEQARQPGGPGTPGVAQNPTVAAMLAQMLASGASAGTQPRPLPPYAQPGAEQARQPGGPGTPGTRGLGGTAGAPRRGGLSGTAGTPGTGIVTGEAAPTRTASGTGWYGETAPPTRQELYEQQGEILENQASQRRQQQRHEAVFAKREEDKRLYGEEYGKAWGTAYALRQQGVRPIDQALMARRLALMAAGQPAGRIPGT